MHEQIFPLLHYFGISNLPSVTSTAQASGWMVQRFAVKEFQYLTCAAWGAMYVEGSHLMMYFVWVAEAAIRRSPVPQY